MTPERRGDPMDGSERAARGDKDDPRGQPEPADSTSDDCIGCGLCGRLITTIQLRRPAPRGASAPPEGETSR